MDWVATVLCLTGTWLLGRKHRVAFLFSAAGNVLYLAWATALGLHSIQVVNVAFLWLQARGWWLWRREERASRPAAPQAAPLPAHGSATGSGDAWDPSSARGSWRGS